MLERCSCVSTGQVPKGCLFVVVVVVVVVVFVVVALIFSTCSVFHVSVQVDKSFDVLGNMNVKTISNNNNNNNKIVHFHPTPKMSTYLVAFAVGK